MKALKWIFGRAVVFALLWFAVIEHVEGAKNIALVLLWLIAVLSPLFLLEKMRSKVLDRVVPVWLDRAVSGIELFGLAWFGVWSLAIPFTIGWFFGAIARALALQDKADLEKEIELGLAMLRAKEAAK